MAIRRIFPGTSAHMTPLHVVVLHGCWAEAEASQPGLPAGPSASGEGTFFLFGLLLELQSIVQLDEQEGFELGLVVIDALQLSDL